MRFIEVIPTVNFAKLPGKDMKPLPTGFLNHPDWEGVQGLPFRGNPTALNPLPSSWI
jgi:hypothetical protein